MTPTNEIQAQKRDMNMVAMMITRFRYVGKTLMTIPTPAQIADFVEEFHKWERDEKES